VRLHSTQGLTLQTHSIRVGRYRLSPMSQPQADGGFAASLSIRSGQGSGTHDRIYFYAPCFATEADAMHYAEAQSREWFAHLADERGDTTPHRKEHHG
jgi:hypothetical protein